MASWRRRGVAAPSAAAHTWSHCQRVTPAGHPSLPQAVWSMQGHAAADRWSVQVLSTLGAWWVTGLHHATCRCMFTLPCRDMIAGWWPASIPSSISTCLLIDLHASLIAFKVMCYYWPGACAWCMQPSGPSHGACRMVEACRLQYDQVLEVDSG